MQRSGTGPRRSVLLAALFCSGSALAATVNYSQDFNAPPSNWTTANDSWSGATDWRNSSGSTGTTPPSLTWYTGHSWTTNFEYKAQVYADWGNTANEVGVIFGLTDATHFYEVTVSMDGVVTLAHANGNSISPTVIKTYSNSPATLGLAVDTPFDLDVQVIADTVIVKINSKLAMPLQKLDLAPPSGKIGLIAQANLGRFDDVSITEYGARQLFRGNFTQPDGSAVGLAPPQQPQDCQDDDNGHTHCYAKFSGMDSSGFRWPLKLWGDGGSDVNAGAMIDYKPQVMTSDVEQYMTASVVSVDGRLTNPDGSFKKSHVLQQRVISMPDAVHQPQIPLVIRPQTTFEEQKNQDLYLRFWVKYPDGVDPDGDDGVGKNSYWQMPWQFITNGSPESLRVSLFAASSVTYNKQACSGGTPASGHWHWLIQGDHGPDDVVWQVCNPTADVPVGTWFKVEIFLHRATSATAGGRLWVAIDGNTVLDLNSPNPDAVGAMYAGGSAMARMNLPQMYGGDEWPRLQYVDDLEIWDGFPSNATLPH